MREVPLTSVEDVEILEMYGNNILKVSTADNAFELSRYSKRFNPEVQPCCLRVGGIGSTERSEHKR